MTSNETLYRMSVVGSGAGFLSWVAREWVVGFLRVAQPDRQIEDAARIADRIDFVLIGTLMGVFCVAFGSGCWGHRSLFRRSLDTTLAFVLGAGAGVFDVWLLDVDRARWAESIPYGFLVVLAWGLLALPPVS